MTDIGQEYAEALFTIGRESDTDFSADLELVAQAFRDNPAYGDLLASPGIALADRLAAIDAAFGDSVSAPIVAFVKLLCEHGRIRHLPECVDAYRDLMNAVLRHSVAEVVSAVALTDAEQEQLRARLEERSGHSVSLVCSVDPSLIGGVIVTMDGTVLDGSVRHRLQDLKEVIDR